MQVAFADFSHRQKRVEIDQRGHFGSGQDRAAALDRDTVDNAVVRRIDRVLGKLGLGAFQLRLCRRQLGTGLVRLELRRIAALHQPLCGGGFRLALHDDTLGHTDSRFLVSPRPAS